MSFFHSLLCSSSDRLSLIGVNNMIAGGDSYTEGLYATSTANRYINIFQTTKGISTLTNVGQNGAGAVEQINAIKNLSYTSSSTLLTAMLGLNEIRRGGSGAKTLKQIEAGFLYYINKHIGTNRVASGSSSVTRTGTFLSTDATANGAVYGAGAFPGNVSSYTTTQNSQWEYSFSGTKIGFVTFGDDGTFNYGRIDIYIDNILQETMDLSSWASGLETPATFFNRVIPVSKMIFGLTDTSHTLKIVAKDVGKIVFVDYFFTPASPVNTGPILFGEIPYLTTAGYATFSPTYNSGSVAASDSASAIIQSLVATYKLLGYKIAYVPINNFLDLTTSLDPDLVHRNDIGHAQMATAFLSKVT